MAGRGAEAPPGTPPVYRAQATGNTVEVASSVSVTIPAAVEIGDVMLLTFAISGTDGALTPSGWTLVSSTTNPSSTSDRMTVVIFRRVAEAGDTGGSTVVTVTKAGSGFYLIASLVAYSGVDATTPIDVSDVAASSSGQESTTVTAPTVTTTTSATKVVRVFATIRDSYATTSITGPATQRSTIAHSVAFTAIAVSDADGAAAGATGTAAATAANSGAWVASTIALKAAA